jgi:hypothetical protein
MDPTVSRAHELLVAAGHSVQVEGPADFIIDGRAFDVKVRRHPTPSDLRRERRRLEIRRPDASLAYVVSRASAALAETARDLPGTYLLAVEEELIVTAGTTERVRDEQARPRLAGSTRNAWGRFAVMRALIQRPGQHRQTDLATATGISQAAVSKALRALGPIADEARIGSRAAAEHIWRDFLDLYPGPQGVTTTWYSLDPPAQQAAIVQARHPEVLASGDAGADDLAPWRLVQHAVLYSTTGLNLADLEFAEADPGNSTLSLTVPADPTIFATARSWNRGRPGVAPMADPALVAWDVKHLGGPDADGAIDKLRARVFDTWQ